MIPMEIAMEMIVKIQDKLIPFTELSKSERGIMISRTPDTVFAEDITGAMAQT